MYNIYGLGKRISSYRKMLGLTQEELAIKLNITAQAVSKWENEISFPEITILPSLAKELNTTIEKLFGNEKDSINGLMETDYYEPRFPENKGIGINLVHTFRNVGCYSEKEVDVTNEDSVIFKDGSSANLNQLKIINRGSGEISFDFIDSMDVCRKVDMNKTELHEVFEKIDSVEIAVNGADFRLVRSKDSKTYVDVLGSPVFISKLSIIEKEGLLSVKCEQENSGGGKSDSNNKVVIAFGSEYGRSINASINGHGDVNIEVPFEKGSVSINGSGDVKTTDISDFSGNINGSGDIKCNKVHDLKIGINGCGDFDAAEVCNSLKAAINGSGDITLRAGELQMFQAAVRGSGDIKAAEVTAQKANISVDGSGDITLGRVVEESIEKHSKGSSIKILKRG